MGSSFSTEEQLFSSLQWSELLTYSISLNNTYGGSEAFHQSRLERSIPTTKEWCALLTAFSEEEGTNVAGAAIMYRELIRPFLGHPPVSLLIQAVPITCPTLAVLVYLLSLWRGQLRHEEFQACVDEVKQYNAQLEAALEANHNELSARASSGGVEEEELEEATIEEYKSGEINGVSKQHHLFGALRRFQKFSLQKVKQVAARITEGSDDDEEGPRSGDADVTRFFHVAVALCQHLCKDIELQHPCTIANRNEYGEALQNLWRAAGKSSLYITCAALIQGVFASLISYGGFAEKASKSLQQIYQPVKDHLSDKGAAVEKQIVKEAYGSEHHSQPSSSNQSQNTLRHMPEGFSPETFVLLQRLQMDLTERQLEYQASFLADNKALHHTMSHLRSIHTTRTSANASNSSSSTSSQHPSSPISMEARWETHRSRYVGQDHIWNALQSHFTTADRFDPEKPTVILFFGPSGLGKSELARCLASVLHEVSSTELESSGRLLYIHMPSFCTNDSIYSLVDPPAAHVGDGILLSGLLKHQDAVVVLDEFEKSTTNAVQHLWLSAFQKNGTLRSLKEASRSVSTSRTTFVLTCNLLADVIDNMSAEYLASGDEIHKAQLRQLLTSACQEKCQELFGDPFVNRVDFFFPFMPYSVTEKERFVLLILNRLLSVQAEKGREIAVTSFGVRTLASHLSTFHAAKTEETVKSLILVMIKHGWSRAVLTSVQEMYTSAPRMLLVPAHQESHQKTNSEYDDQRQNKPYVFVGTDTPFSKRGKRIYWENLKHGCSWMEPWFDLKQNSHTPNLSNESASIQEQQASPSLKPSEVEDRNVSIDLLSGSPRTLNSQAISSSSIAGLATKVELILDKKETIQRKLELEVDRLQVVIKEKDIEIERLTEKVTLLQKALGLLTLAFLSTSLIMALVVGFKLTIMIYTVASLALYVLFDIPLKLVWEALRAVLHLLGPLRFSCMIAFVAVVATLLRRAASTCN